MHVDFFIDGVSAEAIAGWAWQPDDPDAPLTVELVDADGVVATAAPADGFRGDLAAAGKRGGWCTFALRPSPGLAPGEYRLVARAATGAVAIGAPVVRGAPAAHDGDGRLRDADGAQGHVDAIDDTAIGGWIHGGERFGPAVRLALVEDGETVATATADGWRNDLEDVLQGDGRVGFRLVFPDAVRDGREHRFDIVRAGTGGAPLNAAPIVLRTTIAPLPPPAPRAVARPPAGTPVALSVIVNFHDMHREAARTLTSLGRGFQQGVEDLAYEVIAVDNGSDPAMTEAEVARHGPEFRLFRPQAPHPSPIFALNAAAATARGGTLAVMIDGAHLLSPGVLAEAMAAMAETPRTMVAVRHWFIGGDQRWLSEAGYSRGAEDLPFARIGWPDCGYDIFRIGAPIHDSPNTWFDSMGESNCLFLAAADFAALGGYDPCFSMPGAGLANLDLFSRAAALPGMAVAALVGEATFHQYHGGTTTNVSDAEKERRVRHYTAAFGTARGDGCDPVPAERLRLRGRIRTEFAVNARQRPNSRARLGVTPHVRPMPLAQAFEDGARAVACTAYVEAGGPARTLWAGRPTGVAPADLVEIQQMLFAARPEVLVLAGVAPGLAGFVESIRPAIGLDAMRLVAATGEPGDEADRRRVARAIGAAEAVSVLFDPCGRDGLPVDAIRAQAEWVSPGGYLVVLGAAFGQPTLGYSTRWIANAIQRFLRDDPSFAVDETMNAHIVTTCPSGFLRRQPAAAGLRAYDPRLDDLSEFETA